MCTNCEDGASEKLNIAIQVLEDIVRGHALKESGMSTQPTDYSRDTVRLKAADALWKIYKKELI